MQAPTLNGTGISSNVGPSQAAIGQIVALGLGSPDQVERALRASFGDPDRAVEYLLHVRLRHL
jgi:UBA/TS-N domain